MIIPVCCFTCGKVVGHLWADYNKKVSKYSQDMDKSSARDKALSELGLTRYCCRVIFLTHVDILDKLLLYSNNPGEKPIAVEEMELFKRENNMV